MPSGEWASPPPRGLNPPPPQKKSGCWRLESGCSRPCGRLQSGWGATGADRRGRGGADSHLRKSARAGGGGGGEGGFGYGTPVKRRPAPFPRGSHPRPPSVVAKCWWIRRSHSPTSTLEPPPPPPKTRPPTPSPHSDPLPLGLLHPQTRRMRRPRRSRGPLRRGRCGAFRSDGARVSPS